MRVFHVCTSLFIRICTRQSMGCTILVCLCV